MASSILLRSFRTGGPSLSSKVITQSTKSGVAHVSTFDVSDYTLGKTEVQYKTGKHRSNALELINQQPVIEIDGDIAVCDGGGGPLGHPLEYIRLANRVDYEPG